MSVQSRQSEVARYERELAQLEGKRARYAKERADAQRRGSEAQKSIAGSRNPSVIQGRIRDQSRFQDLATKASENEADVARKIADLFQRRVAAQNQLIKEQEREAQKIQQNSAKLQDALMKAKRSFEEESRRSLETLRQTISATSKSNPEENAATVSHDGFISHASEDKDDFVRPLANLLTGKGCEIWYDEFQLSVGDSLRRSIDKGLGNSRFGIVVLSESFFSKNWPQYELDGLVAREMSGGKVILPIWHKVSKDQVMRYSPTLADKVALNTSIMTIEEIAVQLAKVIKGQ